MKFDEIQIGKIMISPPTNSGLKKKDVVFKNTSNDLVPIYSASKIENAIFGWLPRNSKWRKYKNVLTWNKDGSAGIVFYRKKEFIPYEKVKILEIKPEFKHQLNYEYLRKVIELSLFAQGYTFNFKCSMERVLEVYINIPIDKTGNFDLIAQKELVTKYNLIDGLKRDLRNTAEEFMDLDIVFDLKSYTKVYYVEELFYIKKGSSKYTHKYIIENQGQYPVYSSQTTDDGVIGNINSYDFDNKCITWTTDGIYAGTVFYRNGKFSMTTHCGALILKEEFNNLINLKYIFFYLKKVLSDYAIGEGNKRITVDLIKDVPIEIPITEQKQIDFERQTELTKKYEVIENIRLEVSQRLNEIDGLDITFN